MTNRSYLNYFFILGLGGLVLSVSLAGSSTTQGSGIVRLQGATPGSTQNGNIHISGSGLFGSVRADAPSGNVITGVLGTNANGAGVAGYVLSAANVGSPGGFFETVAPGGLALVARNSGSGSETYLAVGGIAVKGSTSTVGGLGVAGFQLNGGDDGGAAGYFETVSQSGPALVARNSGNGHQVELSTPSYGVRAEVATQEGTAVAGYQLQPSNYLGAGGYFENVAPSGYALVARNSGDSSYAKIAGFYVGVAGYTPNGVGGSFRGSTAGVYGVCASPNNAGVMGSGVTNSYLGTNMAYQVRTSLGQTNEDGGGLATYGPSGQLMVGLGHLVGSPANGAVVLTQPGNPNIGRVLLVVNSGNIGQVIADVKNFRSDNPRDSETDIYYASVEGPEAAAYMRGTADLINGRATIILPEHFQDIAVSKGMTIQLTPLDMRSKGLAVIKKDLSGIEVAELMDGNGTYSFDYEVKAVRRGFEDYEVIRPKIQINLPARDRGKTSRP